MNEQFHATVGERFDALDAVSGQWSRAHYEQPLRKPWDDLYTAVAHYWVGLYPDAADECDITAYEVARVAQEAATAIGDDARAYDAARAIAGGDGHRLDSSATRILESMRRHIGDAALAAIVASLREMMRGERPRPIDMPPAH